MQCDIAYGDVAPGDWDDLRRQLDARERSKLLPALLDSFRQAGAVHVIEEPAYIDRDYSAAYSAYYSTLYRSRSKYCRRFHFFASDLHDVWEANTMQEMAERLSDAGRDGAYLGYIVIRPLSHAPVSRALLASEKAAAFWPGAEISVRSTYSVHLMGAELRLEGAPVTEQDSLTGSCAQAAIWAAGRHIHNQHSMPWFSTVDITDAAVRPADSSLSTSLPIGGEALNCDNMVRALKAMGEHPIVYNPEVEGGPWSIPAVVTTARYLDSGIPVIIGFLPHGEDKDGHAVVAVGTITNCDLPFANEEPTRANRITHILVNDDQNGTYIKIPVHSDGQGSRSLETAMFLIIPLPAKVAMMAEYAEVAARDQIRSVTSDPNLYLRKAQLEDDEIAAWSVDEGFYSTDSDRLVARTYLTQGWKYKHRLLRNLIADDFKTEVAQTHLPRFVWVTEFSLPEESGELDPCQATVRAHVVVDATSSRHDGNSPLITHTPGLMLLETFESDRPDEFVTKVHVVHEDHPCFPRAKGWIDYNNCSVKPASSED